MCPLGHGGPLATSSMMEQTSLAPRDLHLLFSRPWARPQGDMGVGRGAPHTLLRSLAVTPSSSRQGSLCTNASIWYFALMNSDLMGLHGTHMRPCEQSSGKLPSRPRPPPLQPHLLDFVLGVGFAPATLHLCRVQQGVLPDGVGPVAGKRVHHLWRRDAKQESAHSVLGIGGDIPRVPAAAGNTTNGPTVCLV